MKKLFRNVTAGLLSASVILSACSLGGRTNEVKAAEQPRPAYRWTFEDTKGGSAASDGTAAGAAVLKGSAKIEQKPVEMEGKSYLPAGNHVLTLSGGTKGSSYAELPGGLYEGVNADTGLTWSFWMKPDSQVASYSRLFSSADKQSKNEFAFTPYARDSVWNLIFDDNANYKQIFDAEPAKGAWTLMTITVSGEEVQFYQNGVLVDSTCGGGDSYILEARLNSISKLVNHALGKTCSTWTDPDCAVQLDDVCLYHTALSASQVRAVAEGYGIDVSQQKPPAEDISDDDGSAGLTEISELKATSPDGSNVVRIWRNADKQYFYSAYRNGGIVIKCSPIGVLTGKEDFSRGLALDTASVRKEKGLEEYDWLQGSRSHVSKEYQECSFTCAKGSGRITFYFRVFSDGMAYRYEIDGVTGEKNEVTEVTGEASSFVLPDAANIWTMAMTPTYEASSYTSRKVSRLSTMDAVFAPPILGKVPVKSGNCWILLAEANVYNEKEPYCASGFCTKTESKALQVKFGQYLKEEQDPTKDGKTYQPTYESIASVKMTDVFHTPWRVSIMTDNLEDLVNSSLISDLNPEAQGDFSWVEPGTSSWSWWSTTSDAIDYDTMYDYIDYAQETGQKYCLVDFGWEVWKDYETKLKELVAYAKPKGVGLLLWYGVNKFDQPHKFDLDNERTIEEQFAWCEKLGIKGVKVDYLNSDSQFAMKVMYDLASIAAKHKLILNYHGCTDPNGENRTFPNILSSEAVMGSEYFKWGSGSPVQSLLMLPYARNVIGSMEFTPVGMSVKNVAATDGFMLAMPVVYESAIQTLAHSAYIYPGYGGSSLLAGLPSTWDESRLLDGYPGDSVIRARRKGENWYLGAMTRKADTYEVSLDFLEPGETYYAYLYTDKEDGTGIQFQTQLVTSKTKLSLPLKKAGGCAVKFSKSELPAMTVHDQYRYYEAEDAVLGEGTKVEETDYASGKKLVKNVGGNNKKNVTFHVNVLEAGERDCKIFFASSSKKDLYIRVNDGEPVKLSKITGVVHDVNAVASRAVKLNFKSGKNTICLYNDTASAPSVDRIGIKKPDIAKAQISLQKEHYVYSGGRHTPAVTVKYGGKTLKEGTDFAAYYFHCVETGTADVTVVGFGEYGGMAVKNYHIYADASQIPKEKEKNETGKIQKPGKVKGVRVKSAKKGTMTVRFQKIKKAKGYQICYGQNKKWKKAKKILVKASASQKTIKKLKRKKTYYVRVRAYKKQGKKNLYGSWSATRKVKIK